jgi:hypothetical protein
MQEVRAQQHGDRRVSIWNGFVDWVPERIVIHTRYDPDLVVERHAHVSDQIIYVLDGELTIGDRPCPKGTVIILEAGVPFGPLYAGPAGAELLEVGLGDPLPVPHDQEGYARELAERGIEPLPRPSFEIPESARPTGKG